MIDAEQPHGAAARPLQAEQMTQQRALARTRAAHDHADRQHKAAVEAHPDAAAAPGRRGYRRGRDSNPEEDLEGIENLDFSNYFEDGDVNGIHMLYRFQIIMTKNRSIPHILNQFDFYLCRTAWDGRTTFLTPRAAHAYRYMINIVNENNYSDVFCHRLAKYFTYGFSIVLPELDLEKVRAKLEEAAQSGGGGGGSDDGEEQPVYLELDRKTPYVYDPEAYGEPQKDDFDGIRFKVNSIHGNCVMVEKNSHVQKQLQNIEQLEIKHLQKIAQNQAAGDKPATNNALYISSLFCSLVSLLRYVSINSVPREPVGEERMPTPAQAFVSRASATRSTSSAWRAFSWPTMTARRSSSRPRRWQS